LTKIVFTVDVDNDGMTAENERNRLAWTSVDEVPRIAELFARRGVPATWFVRADNQLAEVYGDAAWLLAERAALWGDLRGAGHDLGWHPHIVRRENGAFVPETDDVRCAEALRGVHASLAAGGFTFTASRIGEAFHGNESMRTLAELGLAVDSTAIPGRRRADAARRFDWSGTPNGPYRPSAADYRVPGEPALDIVEVPMTAAPVQAPYDERPLPRYLNLAYRAEIFRDAVTRLGEVAVIVTILHPEEARVGAEHPLYAHDLRAVAENVDFLLCRGDAATLGEAAA
jgi:peptidoglycan/xylan/chitin deacetylase (PgdA/CDA1 family)